MISNSGRARFSFFGESLIFLKLHALCLWVTAADTPITIPDSLRLVQAADSAKALANAPILWFESGEKYFPTIPFFTAFKWDRDDTTELALTPELIRPDSSWFDLLQTYNARNDSLHARGLRPEVWVLWDKRELSVKEFQHYLDSDRQFRNRSRGYFTRLRRAVERIEVFRYWLYYLNDTGLEGHPQDIESVYVFVPVWRKDAKVEKEFLAKPLAVVGAGHTEMVPNNVLLCDTPLDAIVILTELGGHSSAPDRNGDGNFNPGYDANWQAANLWGTRDTQASAGLGALGNYESWMTFPRKMEMRCFPPQEEYEQRWHYRLAPAEELKKLYEDIRELQSQYGLQTAADSTRWLRMGERFEKLGGPSKHSWLRMESRRREGLVERLQSWRENQWTYKKSPENGDLEKKAHKKLVAAKHMPWQHSYYKGSVSMIFKRHIFPPTGDWSHWMRGAYVRYAGRRETSAGLILHVTEPPVIRNLFKLAGVVVLEGGFRWVANNTTKIDSIVFTGTDQITGRLLYDVTYNTMFTGYFGWGFETDRKRSALNHTRKFFYGGLKAEYYLEWLPGAFNLVQIRFGVRVPNNGHRLRGNQTLLDLQIGLHR